MKITMCQINFSIADFKSNTDQIISVARAQFDYTHVGPHLIFFPEGSLTGYPLHDLVEFSKIFKIQKKFITQLKNQLPSKAHVIIGAIVPNPKKPGRPYLNAALYFHNRKIRIMAKTLLPTRDVFNDERWFEAGDFKKNVIKLNKKKILVTICEDIWGWRDKKLNSNYTHNPLFDFKEKVDLVINMSASPFTTTKEQQRFVVVSQTALHLKAPLFYCNRWGAVDELVFDGHSLVCQKDGLITKRLKGYQDDTLTVHLDNKNHIIFSSPFKKGLKTRRAEIGETAQAIISGIKEYCKNTGFGKVHLGLSGGIDSAVVACLAVEAMGSENVHAIALPTKFNASESLTLAKEFSHQIGISLQTIDIHSLYLQAKQLVDFSFNIRSFNLTHENLQSRIRGLILMAYSNTYPSLLLATSNKSELATGYGTLYGDLNGGLLPIGDLYKTQVFALANWLHSHKNWIPEQIIKRPPSAELRPNQTDQDSLPEYKILDRSLVKLIEEGQMKNSKVDHFSAGKLLTNEFKRWQAAPIIKVSSRSFGRGRHWPLSHGFKP